MKLSEEWYTLGFLWGFFSYPQPPNSNNLSWRMNPSVPAGPERCLESLPEVREWGFETLSSSTLPQAGTCCLLPESQVIPAAVQCLQCPITCQESPSLSPITQQQIAAADKPSSPEHAKQMIKLFCSLGLSALFLSTGVALSSAVLCSLSLLK